LLCRANFLLSRARGFCSSPLRQLGDVRRDPPGLVAVTYNPRQRLPAHGEKMLPCKAQ
jgi:hypothetical protein